MKNTCEKRGQNRRTHGMRKTSTYEVWASMKQRCLNPGALRFKDYGGRGIRICERWMRFENFLTDMGKRPAGRSLDRKNNDGGYSRENCRWATRTEQMNNTRRTRLISFRGKSFSLTQWAKKMGIKYTTLWMRINGYGWSPQRALSCGSSSRKLENTAKVAISRKYM